MVTGPGPSPRIMGLIAQCALTSKQRLPELLPAAVPQLLQVVKLCTQPIPSQSDSSMSSSSVPVTPCEASASSSGHEAPQKPNAGVAAARRPTCGASQNETPSSSSCPTVVDRSSQGSRGSTSSGVWNANSRQASQPTSPLGLRSGLRPPHSPLPHTPPSFSFFHTSSASLSANPDPTSPSSTAPFKSWLDAAKSRITTPLAQPLPGIHSPDSYHPPTTFPPTEITTLPNGVRIVSEATPGPTASLGLYINSGSVHETSETSGASTLLECLAFKSTQHRDSLRFMKEMELLGGTYHANASREQMAYTVDSLKTAVPQALEVLCDSVLNPLFAEHEVLEQKHRIAFLLQNNPEMAMGLLSELLMKTAYSGALGNPLVPELDSLVNLTPETLRGFFEQHYTAPNIVLAAAGVNHAQLVELATPMLSMLPAVPGGAEPEPASEYKGGFASLPGSSPQASLMLAFEYPGGWRDVNGAVVMTVLTYLMGGGSSFSSGGPGKGMHSRLYKRVLNRHHWVHSCTALANTFNTTGVVGIHAQCEPAHSRSMLDVMCTELESVLTPVSDIELERAKRAAISLIHNALESKATSAEDIGRQMLTYGKRLDGAEYVRMIRDLGPRDISEFVRGLLTSVPVLVVHGDGTGSLRYESVRKRYEVLSTGSKVQQLKYQLGLYR